MLEDETVAVDDGRVTVSHSPQLRLTVAEPGTQVDAGRRRVQVRYALEVSAPEGDGQLTLTTRSVRNRLLTPLVAVDEHYEPLVESSTEGRERTFVLAVLSGQTLQLVIVEHPAGSSPDELAGLLPAPGDFWQAEAVTAMPRSRMARALPPMDQLMVEGGGGPAFEEAAGEMAAPEFEIEQPLEAVAIAGGEAFAMAEPPAAAEPTESVLAEVGANMPSEVHLDDTVPVEVLLSRQEVHDLRRRGPRRAGDRDGPGQAARRRRCCGGGSTSTTARRHARPADAASRCPRRVRPR